MKRVIIIFSLNKNKRYWLEWPSLLCNRKKKCLAILPSNQRFILTIFFSLLSFLYTSSYMKIFHVLFSIVKNLVCQSKIINVFNFSFAAQSVHYNLYLSDDVHLPLFKFLSYGTGIYSCEPYTIIIPVEMSSVSDRIGEYYVSLSKPNICRTVYTYINKSHMEKKIWFKIKYRRY